ncbi:hypothetical protein P5V15_011629 [Pogonomyrmex californicus]
MAHSPVEQQNEIDNEILQLRHSVERHGPQESRTNRRVTIDAPPDNTLLRELMDEIRDLRVQVNGLSRQTQLPMGERTRISQDFLPHPLDLTYGRSYQDIRNQPGNALTFLTLKDALNMIPEIDGTSRGRVYEFLNAKAILCTKFKGKAMMDFRTRDIINFEQLKRELEKEYLSKRSTTHLQLEFNSLKQKPNESAQEFGRRTDNIAMELYESMEEGKNHTIEQQRAILENIKEQALYNYQNGLHDEIKLIVRSQRYQTIQEAIAGATVEEKTRGPSMRTLTYRNRSVFKTHTPSPRCEKCGKIGHYGHECRTSRFSNRYTLPKPERQPRIQLKNSVAIAKR